MTVNPVTGLVTWKTLTTTPATVTVDLFAYDPSGSYIIQHFLIQVAGGSVPPVIGPLPSQVSGKEGQPLVIPVSATDPDGRPLVYWAANLPGGASFDPTTHTLALGARLWPGRHLQQRDLLRQRRGEHRQLEHHAPDRAQPAAAAACRGAGPDGAARATIFGLPCKAATLTAGRSRIRAQTCRRTPRSIPITGVFDWPIGYDQAGTLTVPFTVTSDQRRFDDGDGHLHSSARAGRADLQPAAKLAGERRPADLVHGVRRRSAQPDVRAADHGCRTERFHPIRPRSRR